MSSRTKWLILYNITYVYISMYIKFAIQAITNLENISYDLKCFKCVNLIRLHVISMVTKFVNGVLCTRCCLFQPPIWSIIRFKWLTHQMYSLVPAIYGPFMYLICHCFPPRIHYMNYFMLFWLCCVMTIHRATWSYIRQTFYSKIKYLIIIHSRYTSLLMARQRNKPGY